MDRSPQFLKGRRLVIAGLVLASGVLFILAGMFFFAARQSEQIPSDKHPQFDQTPEQIPMPVALGKQLYSNYCAQCHGDKGDGNGPAAKFLYPKPRDFGEAQFRIVSTVNSSPSDQDLFQVLTRGMPGSAMFPFAHVSEGDRRALVVYVRHLTQLGFVERLQQDARARGEEADPEEELIRESRKLLQPGETIQVPVEFAPASGESVARGGKLYQEACAACHGKTGKGDGAQDQVDRKGIPVRPRDFGKGIFKGGQERQQLYARIMLGMPGSPMPSSSNVFKPDQVGDLINFVLSLSEPAAAAKVEHKRTLVIARKVAEPLSGNISGAVWLAAQKASIVVSPLWWRNYTPPDLHVQALHDGKWLAIRLTWQDETRNDRPVRPQEFEDMAAVQLFKGSPEPFLGMGTKDQPVDILLWRPSWEESPGQYADVDTTYPNMAVDWYPFEQAEKGSRFHPPKRQPREFITAWAAGNLLSDPNRTVTGSNLHARGFGTLTMRPPHSQTVNAKGMWKDGHWTVVLRRPLGVNEETGLPLAPSDRLSIAFALWDGAAGDRNGQKLVSIWHDFFLEK